MTFSKKLVCLHTYLSVQVSSVFCPPPCSLSTPSSFSFHHPLVFFPSFAPVLFFIVHSYSFSHLTSTRTFFSSTSSLIASGLCSFSLSHLPNLLSFHILFNSLLSHLRFLSLFFFLLLFLYLLSFPSMLSASATFFLHYYF
jgi:hypothetical protein